ncbi:MAG: Crp/Fnr family transcriptional regulator [Weeksellaceae bacterium]
MTDFSKILDDVLFQHLTGKEKASIIANSSIISFEEEEMFLKRGSLLFSAYFIIQGEIKIKDQKNRLLNLLGEGNMLGLNYLFNKEPIYFSAYGVKETKIIQIEKNILIQLMSTNSKFMIDMFIKASENSRELVRNLLRYKNQKITGALASFLLYYNEKNCLHALTQKEISEMLGYSRENTNKCLNEYIHSGYIKFNGNSIEVIDSNALDKIQQFG